MTGAQEVFKRVARQLHELDVPFVFDCADCGRRVDVLAAATCLRVDGPPWHELTQIQISGVGPVGMLCALCWQAEDREARGMGA